jgi:hypothetical protein
MLEPDTGDPQNIIASPMMASPAETIADIYQWKTARVVKYVERQSWNRPEPNTIVGSLSNPCMSAGCQPENGAGGDVAAVFNRGKPASEDKIACDVCQGEERLVNYSSRNSADHATRQRNQQSPVAAEWRALRHDISIEIPYPCDPRGSSHRRLASFPKTMVGILPSTVRFTTFAGSEQRRHHR